MRFVCLCCMQRRTPEQDREFATLAAAIDWSRVVAISSRHRVDGLVHQALRQCGIAPLADHGNSLRRKARDIAFHGMALAVETQRLCDVVETADIPVVVLKGTPLALLAYGTVHTKHAKDIDLAVAPDDRAAMREILTDAGYHATGIFSGKDEAWYHSRKRIQIELHTALVDYPSWLAGLELGPCLIRQRVGTDRGLPTLAPDDLFAYLCVHGSTHGWSRLKWLADIAALLAQRAPDEIAALHAHAGALGAERSAAEALVLCADLLGTRLLPEHEAGLRRRRLIRWMVRNARRSFVGSNETVELDAMPLSTLRIHLSNLVATKGVRDRGHLLMTKVNRDRKHGGPARWPAVLTRWLLQQLKVSRHLRSGNRA